MTGSMKFLTMTREELVEYVKEINGLVGAVDGDTISALRRLISKYNETVWKMERYRSMIEYMMDKVPDDVKAAVERELEEVK